MRCAHLSIAIVSMAMLLVACQAADAPDIRSRTAALKPDYPSATYDQALAYNVGRQYGFQPTFIVIHVAQGYYLGTISWFKDPQSGVSSHYVVSKNGDVTQMVEEKDEAIHIGSNVNVLSVGIEHEGFVADPATWFTDSMYQGSAALVKNIAQRWGIPLDRCHILGHDEIPDPTNPCTYGGAEHHTDPGSGWDWNKYMGYIGGSATKCSWNCSSTVGSLVGYVRKGSLLPTAAPVAGAKVSIASGSTTTDAKGFYRFDNLSINYYFSITVTAPGYKTATQNQAVVIPVDHYSNFAMATAPLPDGGPPPPPPPQDQGSPPPPGDGSPPPPPPGDTPVVVGDGGPPPAGDGPTSGSDGSYVPPAGDGQGGGGGGCSFASRAGRPGGPAGLALLLLFALVCRRGRRGNRS